MTDFRKRRDAAEVFGELNDDPAQKFRCHFCQKVKCDTPECAAKRVRERTEEWLRARREGKKR